MPSRLPLSFPVRLAGPALVDFCYFSEDYACYLSDGLAQNERQLITQPHLRLVMFGPQGSRRAHCGHREMSRPDDGLRTVVRVRAASLQGSEVLRSSCK